MPAQPKAPPCLTPRSRSNFFSLPVCKWPLLFLAGIIFAGMVLSGCAEKSPDAEVHIQTARAFMEKNEVESAVAEYRHAIQADPNNDTALFELAEAYVILNQLNTAIRYYNLSAQANPDSIAPHLRLAQIYLQTEQLLEARSQVAAVLKISPDDINARHILSGIQILERDLGAAIDTLEKAAEIAR
ncbi:MAG TPA: tetratricopeptide repeat protein, partial [Desulfotignum sp.]|nr:tetratricopeptide repeat protein [Desulfotignum sp.]